MEQRASIPPGYTGYRILSSLDLPGPGEESLSSVSAGGGDTTCDEGSMNGVGGSDNRGGGGSSVRDSGSGNGGGIRSSGDEEDRGGGRIGRSTSGDEEGEEVVVKGVLRRWQVWLFVLLGLGAIVMAVVGGVGGKCRGRFKGWCGVLDLGSGMSKERRGGFGMLRMGILVELIVWGSTVGLLGLCTAAFFVISVTRRSVGTRRMREIGGMVKGGARAFLKKIYVIGAVFALAVFVGIGLGLDWKTAGCYLVGVVISALAQWIGVEVAIMGAIRTSCAACFAPAAALNVAFRGAVVVSLVNVSLGLIAVAGVYLVVRDLEAMIGLIAGSTTVSILLRISTAVYAKGADISADLFSFVQGEIPRDDPRNPAIIADLVGDNLSAVGGLGADLFESYIGSIIATALLARGLPFFEKDPFALCVNNHLHIDALCRASAAEPVFFARALCLQGNLYKSYPSATPWASNSLFVALPILLALSGVLVSIVVTFYVHEPKIGTHSSEECITSKLLNSLRINVVISTGLLVIVAAALCWGLFGPRSRFGQTKGFGRDDSTVPRFVLNGTGTAGCPNAVAFFELSKNGLTPDKTLNGTFVPSTYSPIGLSRRNKYPASETPARLFSCIVIGLALGTFFGLSTEYFTSASYSPTQSVAMRARYGAPLGLIQGLGMAGISTVLSLVVLIASIIGNAKLYGGYGVALSSVGVMAGLGLTMAFEVIAAISDTSDGIAESSELSSKVRTTTLALDSLGDTTGAIGKGFSNGAGILAAYALYLAFTQKIIASIQVDGVMGPAVFIGTIKEEPVRHVTQFVIFPPNTPDEFTVAGISFGILMPGFVGSLITLSISCAGQRMIAEIRRHYAVKRSVGERIPEGQNGEVSLWMKYIRLASREGLLGSVLPFILTITSPIIMGFMFGSVTLHSYLLAVIGAGYLQGLLYITSGSSFDNAKKAVKAKKKPSKSWAQAVLVGDLLGDSMKDGVGVNMSMFIKASVVSGILTISLLDENRGKIWVGVIILGIFLILGGSFALWKQLYNAKHTLNLKDEPEPYEPEKTWNSTARWVAGDGHVERSFPSLRGESDKSSSRLLSSPFYEPRPLGAFNMTLTADPRARRCFTMPPPQTTSDDLRTSQNPT